MTGFFRFFAQRNLLAFLITTLIILMGLAGLTKIQRDNFPRVDFGEVYITTTYPGASPEDVELKVTNKIEEELHEVTGVDRFFSWSMEDVSFIGLRIDAAEPDPEGVKTEIREAVGRVTDLPVEVTESPLITELDTSVIPVVEVGLSGDIPYAELRELARRFEKKLKVVPGVTRLERFGYRDREVAVAVDPEKAADYAIPLARVIGAIQGRNVRATGGSFESYTSERNIVTLAQFKDPMEVGDVIVRTTFDGPAVRIRDLAQVVDGFEDETVESRMNGRPAISFLAHKASNADIIRTVDAIKKLVEKERLILPEGVEIHFFNDNAIYVQERLDIVMTNGAIGLALVMLNLTLFLNRRIAFWVALGIPVSILGVIFLLPLFDCYLDTVTLTAMVLVIGIIVDDAIIISEAIYSRFEAGEPPLDAAVNGIRSVIQPVVTTILTTFVAFAPLFFMPGMLGKFVYVIPLVITLALLISMTESTLALPAHLAKGLKKVARSGGGAAREGFAGARRLYLKVVSPFLKLRYLSVGLFAVVLAGALGYAAKYMDFILFPSNTADKFYVAVELPKGASIHATSDKVREIEGLVRSLPEGELDSFVTRVGTTGDVLATESENVAAVWVALTPFASRDRTADEIVAALRAESDKLPGYDKITYMIDSGGPPVGRPVELRVVGSDDAVRQRLAADVVAFLEGMDGVSDVDRNDRPGKEQIELKLDYEALSRAGLTVADVAQNVRIAYDGEVVTTVRYGDEDVDFRVIFPESVRADTEYLKHMQVPNRDGRMIELAGMVRLETGPSPSNYYHWSEERAITVTADVDDKVITPVAATGRVTAHFDLTRDYPGMRIVVGGEAQESAESMRDLFIIFGIAAVGIYFLLVLLFNSLLQPLLVMMALPFGIVGVIAAFALHGQPMSFLAMTGLIGLAGVVVNDSLVLVHRINGLRAEFPGMPMRDLVARGGADRLRPILITTATTVSGLLPLAYGLGGADPYMGPMALALGYGLLCATPLTLVLVPCLYLIGDDVKRLFRKKTEVPEA